MNPQHWAEPRTFRCKLVLGETYELLRRNIRVGEKRTGDNVLQVSEAQEI